MIGLLNKLEAFDGGSAAVVAPSSTSETPKPPRRKPEPQDRRLLSVPSDGWIGGPGRSSGRSIEYTPARG